MATVRIAVLRGGPSDEYAVSMLTGAAVLEAIDRSRYEPVDITITRGGAWLHRGREIYPEQILNQVDGVFIALHGTFGEDGKVQRILDRFGVPYTGSRAYPSSIAMHKVLTKDHLRERGIKMAPHMVVSRQSKDSLHAIGSRIGDLFGPQYVIKPVSSGSSVGTMMVQNATLLPRALDDALEHYDQVIVEKRIIGKEATCGVVDRFRGQATYSCPPIEIVPPAAAGFFNEQVKYDGSTEERCPGRFSVDEKRKLERIAREVHELIGLSQYSRSDFMVAPEGIYFLEVNTLPGLTKESLFPKALAAVGSSHSELVNHLIEDMFEHWCR